MPIELNGLECEVWAKTDGRGSTPQIRFEYKIDAICKSPVRVRYRKLLIATQTGKFAIQTRLSAVKTAPLLPASRPIPFKPTGAASTRNLPVTPASIAAAADWGAIEAQGEIELIRLGAQSPKDFRIPDLSYLNS